jgi:hypothetical protein
MLSANDYNQHIKEVEFITTYPRKGSATDNVMVAIVLLENDKRALVYAPAIRPVNLDFTISEEYEDYGFRGVKLGVIPTTRHVKIGCDLYTISKENGTLFSVFLLDDAPAPHVNRKEIEKLFGCVIDG